MKKLFFTSCLLVLNHLLSAQVNFGIKAGLNNSNLKVENNLYKNHSRMGICLGGFFRYDLSGSASLQGELDYSAEGGKWTRGSTSGIIKEAQIRIPVLLQYKTASGIYAEAGPQYNLLLSFKESVDGDPAVDEKDNMKSGVFGYALGAGYMFSNALSGLRIGLRYNGDFSEMNKVEVSGTKLRNSLIQVALFYDLNKVVKTNAGKK